MATEDNNLSKIFKIVKFLKTSLEQLPGNTKILMSFSEPESYIIPEEGSVIESSVRKNEEGRSTLISEMREESERDKAIGEVVLKFLDHMQKAKNLTGDLALFNDKYDHIKFTENTNVLSWLNITVLDDAIPTAGDTPDISND